MTFIDTYDGRPYTMRALHDDYISFRQDEPYNHAPDFVTELYEILMASVNGRNDLDVINMTPREIESYIYRLRRIIESKSNNRRIEK